MNTILQAWLGAILRYFLMLLAGFLVKHGIWTDSAAAMYVQAAIPFLLALIWSYRRIVMERVKLLTALMLAPGATENDVKAKIKSGDPLPTVTTPPNTIPGVPK